MASIITGVIIWMFLVILRILYSMPIKQDIIQGIMDNE